MLIKPDLKDEDISRCLYDAYGLHVTEIFFLPLGAEPNTAVYRVQTRHTIDYFLKLRLQEFCEASVLVPKYLATLGFKQVIAPWVTKSGKLWTNLGSCKVVLYPYIEGNHSMDVHLSDQQWCEFGATLKKFHRVIIPEEITQYVPRDKFSSKWRNRIRRLLERIKDESFSEPIAAEMALFLKSQSTKILNIVRRAEHLASVLQKQSLNFILCHADIHGWNVFIGKNGACYIVDWDTLVFAPKERDLMFIGAGLGDSGRTVVEEERLFYQGYGSVHIHENAIAYYRYERVIEDIAVSCQQVFWLHGSAEDRLQTFQYLQANFLPNGTIARAFQSDQNKDDNEH